MFYFDFDDGTNLLRDDIGLELADEQAARDEGARALGEIAKEYVPTDVPQKNISAWVRNEEGEVICQVALSFTIRKIPT
jgi:hypothetical protein